MEASGQVNGLNSSDWRRMKAAIADGFSRWKDFSGRTGRSHYWWWILFLLLTPLASTILFVALAWGLSAVGLSGLPVSLFLMLSYWYVILIPLTLSMAIRRLRDVGVSGWWILVPVANLYFLVQPAVEAGRIPRGVFAERACAVFAALSLLGSLSGDVTASIGGVIFWGLLSLGLRVRNLRKAT
jgi:uncharacterized membrane protein YhaH (DUF805 family)